MITGQKMHFVQLVCAKNLWINEKKSFADGSKNQDRNQNDNGASLSGLM